MSSTKKPDRDDSCATYASADGEAQRVLERSFAIKIDGVDGLQDFVDALNVGFSGRMWSWASLPGLAVSDPTNSRLGGELFYLNTEKGILSVGQVYIHYVLEAVRLGLSMVDWLYNPATFGDRYIAAKNRASGKPICTNCDGTGNELQAMYRKCSSCDGEGVLDAAAPTREEAA